MKIIFLLSSILAFQSVSSASNFQCSTSQVMKTLRQNKSYRAFEYASAYSGEPGGPTLIQHESSDQYIFWIDNNGQTCPAIVTYESGKCIDGKAIVRLHDCQ